MTDNQDIQEKFLELYEPCRESLVRFSKAMTRNMDDAMDLVQETTLKAFQSFGKVQSPVAFTSYLFTIASRIHKRQSFRKRIFRSFSGKNDDRSIFDNIRDNNGSADRRHDIAALYAALDKLPPGQKEAVILFEISGLSIAEISKIQDVSVPGVKSRIQRGRKALAALLGVADDTRKLDNPSADKDHIAFKSNVNYAKLINVGLIATMVTHEIL